MSIHFGDFDGSRVNVDSVRSVTLSPLNSTVSPRRATARSKGSGLPCSTASVIFHLPWSLSLSVFAAVSSARAAVARSLRPPGHSGIVTPSPPARTFPPTEATTP